MAFNQRTQTCGFNHLDLVAPLIEMPRHLKPSGRMEPHDEAAILLRIKHLGWMEAELGSTLGGLRREPPDDLAMLRRILIDAESLCGVVRQRKPRLEREALVKACPQSGFGPCGS